MSIVFQLFNAADLNTLDDNALEQLKQTIWDAFHTDKFLDRRKHTTLAVSPLFTQDLQNKFRRHITTRAQEVFKQLTDETLIVSPDHLNLLQPLYPQILSQEAREKLNTPLKREIFEMAISCEVTHVNGYMHLLAVKEEADKKFRDLRGGVSPAHNPDTLYSPLNPDVLLPINWVR